MTDDITQQITALITAASTIDRHLFSDLDGVPAAQPEEAQAISSYLNTLESQLNQIHHLLQAASVVTELGISTAIQALREEADSSSAQRTAEQFNGLKIEEIIEEESKVNDIIQDPENSLIVSLILLAALHGGSAPPLAAAAPPPGGTVPWSNPQTSAAAEHILDQLASIYSSQYPEEINKANSASVAARNRPNAGDLLIIEQQHEQPQSLSSRERLLATFAPLLHKRLHPTLTAYSTHMKNEKSRIQIYEGPDIFERIIAAQQLGLLVACFSSFQTAAAGYPQLAASVIPSVLACLDDPVPSIQVKGLWSLTNIAGGITLDTHTDTRLIERGRARKNEQERQSLSGWEPVLREAVFKAIKGCDEQVWPPAVHALISLTLHFQADSPYNSQLHSAMNILLEEAERQAHAACRALLFVQTIPILFPLLGLQLVRYFSRLIPLLLEWSLNYSKALRSASVSALNCVLIHTWPRAPAHAPVLWVALERVLVDEKSLSKTESLEVVSAVIECGITLWQCGGEEFRKEQLKEKKENGVSGDPGDGGLLLEAVLKRV